MGFWLQGAGARVSREGLLGLDLEICVAIVQYNFQSQI